MDEDQQIDDSKSAGPSASVKILNETEETGGKKPKKSKPRVATPTPAVQVRKAKKTSVTPLDPMEEPQKSILSRISTKLSFISGIMKRGSPKISDFVEVIKKPTITISWESVYVGLPGPGDTVHGQLMCWEQNVKGKVILENITGTCKPGTLLGILGPSGSGKTTLLNVLNFRNRGNLKINGQIKVNGLYVQKAAEIAEFTAYVQDRDAFIETLTVREQLRFYAELKMKQNSTEEDINERVDQVMDQLYLRTLENTRIGHYKKTGIAKGERRRLSFACELITNPNLIFFDEPTKGLDNYMSKLIIECMKKLNSDGKTIICTLHQPSNEILNRFDKICLMAQGKLAFFGDVPDSLNFFNSMGYTKLPDQNPADFFIEVLAATQNPNNKDDTAKTARRIADGFEKSQSMMKLRKELIDGYEESLSTETPLTLGKKIRYRADVFTQIKMIWWRKFIDARRSPFKVILPILYMIVAAVVLGLIYLRSSEAVAYNGILFVFVLYFGITVFWAEINSYSREIPMVLMENSIGLYHMFSYFVSKLFKDLLKYTLWHLIFISIAYWMSSLNYRPNIFFTTFGILLLMSGTTAGFGTLLAASTPSYKIALTIAVPIFAVLFIFSGYFLDNVLVPSWLIWLRYLSWFNYAYENLIVNQWSGYGNIVCNINLLNRCFFANGSDVLTYTHMKPANFQINMGAMAIIMAGWYVLGMVALYIRSITEYAIYTKQQLK